MQLASPRREREQAGTIASQWNYTIFCYICTCGPAAFPGPYMQQCGGWESNSRSLDHDHQSNVLTWRLQLHIEYTCILWLLKFQPTVWLFDATFRPMLQQINYKNIHVQT